MRRSRLVPALLALAAVLALPATARAELRTETLRAGPYTLGEYKTEMMKLQVPRPKASGYVTYMHSQLVDRRGRVITIQDGMLHHVFFKNMDRYRVAGICNSRQKEVFYGTGEENQALDLPRGYGYRLARRDRWEMSGMLMSHRYHRKKVWVQYKVSVDTARRTGVRPMWVRANGCGRSSIYNVTGDGPPGSVHDQVYRWRVPMTGRIVAAGGHLHGGAVNMQMREPSCRNRVLFDHKPSYAPQSHILYNVKPRLHEAGPIQTSWFSSRTGIPVSKGEVLNLHGLYENNHARAAVMAITHVYMDPRARVPNGCVPLPEDAHQSRPKPGTRPSAPYQPIPLYRLDRRHQPVHVPEPPGPAKMLRDGATIALRAFRFQPEKVTVNAGSTINWNFRDVARHSISLASGPRVVGPQAGTKGEKGSMRFTTPGRYQLFCYLHPMTMREQVTVLP